MQTMTYPSPPPPFIFWIMVDIRTGTKDWLSEGEKEELGGIIDGMSEVVYVPSGASKSISSCCCKRRALEKGFHNDCESGWETKTNSNQIIDSSGIADSDNIDDANIDGVGGVSMLASMVLTVQMAEATKICMYDKHMYEIWQRYVYLWHSRWLSLGDSRW